MGARLVPAVHGRTQVEPDPVWEIIGAPEQSNRDAGAQA